MGGLFAAFVMCAAVGGLVASAAASGTLRWDDGWLDPPPPRRAGSSIPPEPPRPPATYPVVPALPGMPPARYLQPVYAVPYDAKPVRGRPEAILHEIGEVTAFFQEELDGAYPRYAPDGQAPSVVTAVLPWSGHELKTVEERLNEIGRYLHDQDRIEPHAIPLVYVEASTDREACGWASVFPEKLKRVADPRFGQEAVATYRASIERRDYIMIALHRCPGYHLSHVARWPGGATHLLAHETTHALGAVEAEAPHYAENGHTGDDPRDILYRGPEGSATERYVIDPGHDDYYRHGRSDLTDIADSELLVHPPGTG